MTLSRGRGLGRGNVSPAYFVGNVGTRGFLSMHPDEKHALDVALQLVLRYLDVLIDKGKPKNLDSY